MWMRCKFAHIVKFTSSLWFRHDFVPLGDG